MTSGSTSAGRVLAAALVALVASLGPGAAAAQDPAGSPREVADAFARAWSGNDASALEPLLARGGVSLELEASARQIGVAPRQAAASVARLLDRHEATGVSVRRSDVLGGDPPHALAELVWEARPRGTRERTPRIIFLGMERTQDGWTIVEIRLLS